MGAIPFKPIDDEHPSGLRDFVSYYNRLYEILEQLDWIFQLDLTPTAVEVTFSEFVDYSIDKVYTEFALIDAKLMADPLQAGGHKWTSLELYFNENFMLQPNRVDNSKYQNGFGNSQNLGGVISIKNTKDLGVFNPDTNFSEQWLHLKDYPLLFGWNKRSSGLKFRYKMASVNAHEYLIFKGTLLRMRSVPVNYEEFEP